jgi:hypothetical protein
MKRSVAAFVFLSLLSLNAIAAGKGPEVNFIDDKLSVQADGISLGRLLQLLDVATGMKSKVPPELANRNLSVMFSGLTVSDAVRKIFQGQPFDYVMIQGQGIIVTAASQAVTGADSPLPFNAAAQGQQFVDQPFVQEFPPGAQFPTGLPQQTQPAMVQTPFGPIPNPRAQQAIQQQQQNNTPLSMPVPQNSLFPQAAQPMNQPQNNPPGIPLIQPGNPTPFGTASPFGTVNQPASNPNVFGTSPVFSPPPQ